MVDVFKSHYPKRGSRLTRTLGSSLKTQGWWTWDESVTSTKAFGGVVSVELLMKKITAQGPWGPRLSEEVKRVFACGLEMLRLTRQHCWGNSASVSVNCAPFVNVYTQWMASLTRWMCICVNSWSWWWTARPGMLQSRGLQGVGHNWAIELDWNTMIFICANCPCACQLLV